MKEIFESLQNICIEISKYLSKSHSNTYSNNTNTSGDIVHNLDIITNDIFSDHLSNCPSIFGFASEENDDVNYLNTKNGKYFVVFDPLDGSQNIDVNLSIGSIFGIFKVDNSLPKSGRYLVASGYALYGPSTVFVWSTIGQTNLYKLVGNKFILDKENIRIPDVGKYYSVNESNRYRWRNDNIRKFFNDQISLGKSNRWDGCMVADVHRLLLKGGSFSYPKDEKSKDGKLRLVYECYPMSFIIENSYGFAITEDNFQILDIEFPQNIHQKSSILLLGTQELNNYQNYFSFYP